MPFGPSPVRLGPPALISHEELCDIMPFPSYRPSLCLSLRLASFAGSLSLRSALALHFRPPLRGRSRARPRIVLLRRSPDQGEFYESPNGFASACSPAIAGCARSRCAFLPKASRFMFRPTKEVGLASSGAPQWQVPAKLSQPLLGAENSSRKLRLLLPYK